MSVLASLLFSTLPFLQMHHCSIFLPQFRNLKNSALNLLSKTIWMQGLKAQFACAINAISKDQWGARFLVTFGSKTVHMPSTWAGSQHNAYVAMSAISKRMVRRLVFSAARRWILWIFPGMVRNHSFRPIRAYKVAIKTRGNPYKKTKINETWSSITTWLRTK